MISSFTKAIKLKVQLVLIISAGSVPSANSVEGISVKLKLFRVKSTFSPDKFRRRVKLAESKN